jgi:hypothetical protein
LPTQYLCKDEERRRRVAGSPTINGIDHLEVSADQKTLRVFLFPASPPTEEGPNKPSAEALTGDNVVIEGGTRVRDVRVQSVTPHDNVLTVDLDRRGDSSTYRLRLVASPEEPDPPAGFDRQLSEIEFSFEVDRPREFDCKEDETCPEPVWPAPQIDYLAKDYASFRRLMLDRLSVIMPDWRERNPADIGVVLVELLAYVADNLSYHQDAVATEAYLGTARRRVSVRRHARLLDYPTHDGSNARAWVAFRVDPGVDGEVLPGPSRKRPGSRLLTRIDAPRAAVKPEEMPASTAGVETFETLHDISLRAAHNEIGFYTWGDERCCLPKGATRASLRRENEGGSVQLAAGDVLIFEEIRGPESGRTADADPAHRHAVRLTQVAYTTDPLYEEDDGSGSGVVNVEWAPEDALPFPLCLWEVAGQPVSVARGNVVLADHGRTFSGERLGEIPSSGRYPRTRPRFGPLTQQGHARDRLGRLVLDGDDRPVRFDPEASASAAMRWETRDVLPAIELRDEQGVTWRPRRDLLNSDRFAAEFVVESEDDGSASLRFGDGASMPGRPPGDDLRATYRVGTGRAGNVGAEAIAHVVTPLAGIVEVRNPLPAVGGTDPEPIEQVRLYAPHAFRTQERAVTEADYEAAAQRHPEVQRAAATRRWTGSWYTWFITVDRRGGRPVDTAFEAELRTFLERFRLAGYDLEVDAPRFVPLDVALVVRVAPGYIRGNVEQALLRTFGTRDLPDGRRGFFHPDNFTFGRPVYLSQVVAAAMEVPGVAWVKPVRFQRWEEEARDELRDGRIAFERLEIARLDNDPDAPDNGRIEFNLEGGP